MNALWTWLRNKAGRIITSIGVILSGVETLDISSIKDPLEAIVGHKGVQVTALVLFAASFARHQLVANQHPKDPP